MSTTSRLGDAGVLVTPDIIPMVDASRSSRSSVMRHSQRQDVRYRLPVSRRDDVVIAATDLLRESGPAGLTSVSVAARLGLTQSAIYRHIRDMDELTTIASQTVVGELTSVMFAAVAEPERS